MNTFLKEKFRVLFGLPQDSHQTSYKGRILILFVLQFHLLLWIFIVGHLFESSLIYDQINFISLMLGIPVVVFVRTLYVKPKELISFVIAALVALTFLTQNVILNIDRSRSFYVLSWVDRGAVTYVDGTYDFNRVVSAEKLNEKGVVHRIEEQISRGYIRKNEKGLELTWLGSSLLELSNLIAGIFNLRGWHQNLK